MLEESIGKLKIPVSGVRLPPQPPVSLLLEQTDRSGAGFLPRHVPHTLRACTACRICEPICGTYRSANPSRIPSRNHPSIFRWHRRTAMPARTSACAFFQMCIPSRSPSARRMRRQGRWASCRALQAPSTACSRYTCQSSPCHHPALFGKSLPID